MINKMLAYSILTVIISVSYCRNSYSWDNEVTHKDLATYSAEASVLSKDNTDYLKSIGFTLALDEVFAWQGKNWTITKWLRDGAEREDAGTNLQGFLGLARYNNHFHNPLKPWGSAGLDDLVFGKQYLGESSVLWAQYGSWQAGYPEGDWSWNKARDSFYRALTSRTDQDRQANFAQTFRALGHQMHLIQDMAVPAHVRNDAHPEDAFLGQNYLTGDIYFETWAKMNSGIISSFASAPALPNVDLNISRSGLAPVSQFIDAEQYNGTWPGTSLTWGLAEYTGSNFVSTDTIFTENFSKGDRHYFPFPSYSANSYEMFELNHSPVTKRIYLKKKGDGEYIQHFVTTGPLFKYLSFDPVLQKKEFKLDGTSHYDYVSKLVPRAVGYSAGLLNYFFRGDLEAKNPRALKDSAGNVIGAKLSIRNKTAGETMGYGKVVMAYQYKPFGSNDTVYGISNESSLNERIASGSDSTAEFTFYFMSSVPVNAQDIKYFLVYRGNLGSETDAVAAKIFTIRSPRGGLIYKNNPHYVYVGLITDAGTKTTQIFSSQGEELIKAAFDEGSVDDVRLLTMTQVGDQIVWYVTAFTYDKKSEQYSETGKNEVLRTGPIYSKETIYTIPPGFGGYQQMCSHDVMVRESPGKSISIGDFFVPDRQDIKFLKQELNTVTLGNPFVLKEYCDLTDTFKIWDYVTQTYKSCNVTGSHIEEYIGGSYEEGPNCRNRYDMRFSSPDCGVDYFEDVSGYCYSDEVWADAIQYSYWKSCNGDFIPSDSYHQVIWLNASVTYDAINEVITNPRNNIGSPLWTADQNGPCLLTDPNAKFVYGQASGRILSENLAAVQSEVKQWDYSPGYRESVYKGITIEPTGIVLDEMPSVLLRQTGGYSMLKLDGTGTAIGNRSSHANLPPDRPILLNGKGSGFKVSYTTQFEQRSLIFQVGTGYNAQTKDFTGVSSNYYTSLPGLIMDVMVEY